MTVEIPAAYRDLLEKPIVVMLATLMPDNQPQVTPVWCSLHGNQIWVNSAPGRQKDLNMLERPQVTVAVYDPENAYRYIEVRGRVVETVDGEAAWDHIDALAHAYFGRGFSRGDDARRIYKIEPLHVNAGG